MYLNLVSLLIITGYKKDKPHFCMASQYIIALKLDGSLVAFGEPTDWATGPRSIKTAGGPPLCRKCV